MQICAYKIYANVEVKKRRQKVKWAKGNHWKRKSQCKETKSLKKKTIKILEGNFITCDELDEKENNLSLASKGTALKRKCDEKRWNLPD